MLYVLLPRLPPHEKWIQVTVAFACLLFPHFLTSEQTKITRSNANSYLGNVHALSTDEVARPSYETDGQTDGINVIDKTKQLL